MRLGTRIALAGRPIARGADRALQYVLEFASPRRALTRLHLSRMRRDPEYRMWSDLLMRSRGYRSAKRGEGQTGWLGAGGTADQEILIDLPAMRNRSREVNRDDPVGSGLTLTFVNNVVGTGMQLQWQTEQREWDKAIEAVWKVRKDLLFPADRLTFPNAQRQIGWKRFEDGEVLIKPALTRAGDPVFFEVIEADRLATPRGQTKSKNKDIRDGVERDGFGRVVAYWILKQPPTELLGAASMGEDAFVRVPAEVVWHWKDTRRPGQSRGVPMLQAVFQDLRDLDLLMLASLKRVQISALLSVFIKSTALTEDIVGATAREYGYVMDEELVPGMMMKLYPDEEIQTLVPNFPTPELAPFIVQIARRIGTAVGVSWQMVLKDFSDSTYSSARSDLLESRRVFWVLQKCDLEPLCKWIAQIVLEDAQLRGEEGLGGVPVEAFAECHGVANGWEWVDPEKEAKASQIELGIGTTTLQIVCGSKGRDWEEVLMQRLREEQRENELRKELGLGPKAAAPGQEGGPGGQGGGDERDEEDEEDEEDEARARRNGHGRRVAAVAGSG